MWFRTLRNSEALAKRQEHEAAVEEMVSYLGLPEKCQPCPVARLAASMVIAATERGNRAMNSGISLMLGRDHTMSPAVRRNSLRLAHAMAMGDYRIKFDGEHALTFVAGTAEENCEGAVELGFFTRLFSDHDTICVNEALQQIHNNAVITTAVNSDAWELPEPTEGS